MDDPSVVAVRTAEVPRIVLAAPALMAGRPTPQRAQDLQPLPWLALINIVMLLRGLLSYIVLDGTELTLILPIKHDFMEFHWILLETKKKV